MIVEIDHIALASQDPDREIVFFEKLGYHLQFKDIQRPNLGIKRTLLKNYSEKQNLALLTSSQNIGVELVGHGKPNERTQRFFPVFENFDAQPMPFDKSIYKEGVKLFSNSKLSLEPADSQFRFTACILLTPSLQSSIPFWKFFGFREKGVIQNGVVLEFASAFKKKMTLLLMEDSQSSDAFHLDDAGFNCLAFISTDAHKEHQILKSKGFEVTDIETVFINQKNLDVFFARNTTGEIVEVISVSKSEPHS